MRFKSSIAYTTRMFYILMVFAVASCDVETPRIQKLREEIAANQQTYQHIKANWDGLRKEMTEIWVRSLGYRFPKVQPIDTKEITLLLDKDGLGVLKSVRFQKRSNNNLRVYCTYYHNEPKSIRPQFILYLFDEYGVNIHKQTITYKGWFGGALSPGKLVTKKFNIDPVGERMPQYFLVGKSQ